MTRTRCPMLAAAFALILAIATAASTADDLCPTMLVRRLRADFDRPDPVPDFPVSWDQRSARVVVEARFIPLPALDAFDPELNAVTLAAGPAYLGDFAGSRKSMRGRQVEIRSRRWGPRHGHRIRIDLRRGRLRAEIRDADVGGLLAEGPAGCVVAFDIGGVTYRDAIDARPDGRKWRFAATGREVPPPPGGAPPTSASEDLPFRPLASGDSGGSLLARGFAVRGDADLARVWAFRRGEDPVPVVDFDSESVVFVDLGRRPTGQYRIDVRRVVSGACGVVVDLDEIVPSTGTTAETHPWVAIAITGAAGTVELNRTVVED